MLFRRSPTLPIILLVSASELPGAVVTLIMIVPWSSSGTRPVLVLFISSTSPIIARPSVAQVSHLCLMNTMTPRWYFLSTALKAVL